MFEGHTLKLPKVLYEDKDIVAVYKPAGLVVHASAGQKKQKGKGIKTGKKKIVSVDSEPTLVDWLVKKYPEIKTVGDDSAQRPGIVHRLDKATSGVMLVARNQPSFVYLKSLFMRHMIQKTYHAIVFGVPVEKSGVIDAPIGIKNGTLRRSVVSVKMQKDAVTEYHVLKTFTREGQKFSLLEIFPKTGRTHQIRVHLASVGHAIVGDPLYGPKRQPSFVNRLMLHARAIEFKTRDGKMFRITTEDPLKAYCKK